MLCILVIFFLKILSIINNYECLLTFFVSDFFNEYI